MSKMEETAKPLGFNVRKDNYKVCSYILYFICVSQSNVFVASLNIKYFFFKIRR